MKQFFFLFFLAFFSFSLYGQSENASSKGVAQEYEVGEFPQGVEDFRRFEQIFLGAFPFSIFFAQLLGGLGLAIEDGIVSSQTGQPSTFSYGVENYRFDDKVRIIASGVGISFGIAVIDMILYQIKLKEESNKYKRKKVLTKALSNKVVEASLLGEGELLLDEKEEKAEEEKSFSKKGISEEFVSDSKSDLTHPMGVPPLPQEAFSP